MSSIQQTKKIDRRTRPYTATHGKVCACPSAILHACTCRTSMGIVRLSNFYNIRKHEINLSLFLKPYGKFMSKNPKKISVHTDILLISLNFRTFKPPIIQVLESSDFPVQNITPSINRTNQKIHQVLAFSISLSLLTKIIT